MSQRQINVAIQDSVAASSGLSNESCPNCDARAMTTCYEVRRVPVHSCLLVSDREEAQRYPCGDIRLAHCAECGFISNLLFNPAFQDYSPDYEESQHYSSHFSAFARRLAAQWVNDYGIRNKTILEIGCGKGEFLDIFCELGENNGIGIDPACDPPRLSETANKRLRFISDLYSPKYKDLQADVIVCRHTLEHIAPTGEFIGELRQAIGDRRDTLVLFELPDMTRVLREQAFWDIYYEHCSYFTVGSLARLFLQNSFEVIDLRRDYNDQYLVLAARPIAERTRPDFDLERDLEQTNADVAAFQAECPKKIRFWQDRLRRFADEGRKVAAWGSGSKFVSLCTTLGVSGELSYAVDINPHKSGKYVPGTGHQIVSPEYLQQDPPDVIVAMNPVYRDEIQVELDRLGVKAELLTL